MRHRPLKGTIRPRNVFVARVASPLVPERTGRVGMGLLVGAFILLVGGSSCSKKTPPSPSSAGTSSAQGVVAPVATTAQAASWTFEQRQRDYQETIGVFRTLYPRYCKVKRAEEKWDDAHDKARSYSAAVAALRALEQTAREEATKPMDVAANEQCGKRIRSYLTSFLANSPKIAARNLSCVESHRAVIEQGLKSGPFSEAAPAECGEFLPVPGVEMDCVRNLFACGTANCEHYDVAARLGLACDPKENTSAPMRFHDWK